MINQAILQKLYVRDRQSMADVAATLQCSVNKVVYYMDKYKMPRRSISQAIYHKAHPKGDPFAITPVKTRADAILYGMGVGLYWGEGTKANKHSVRLGNSDPGILRVFMEFLVKICGVKIDDLRFGLQIFTDINPEEALNYWTSQLGVQASQFYKIQVTISGSIGTYRNKSLYGVTTVYYNNKRLRDALVGMLPR